MHAITLDIPSPCHVPASEMSPSANGEYCHSCKKEVIDISAMSGPEIENLMFDKGANLCLSGYSHQFGVQLNPAPPKKNRRLVVPLMAAALGIAVPELLYSQKIRASEIIRSATVGFGIVQDEHGHGLTGATISLKNTSRQTQTSEDGTFWIENGFDKDILIVSHVGYRTKEFPITTLNSFPVYTLEKEGQVLDTVTVKASYNESRLRGMGGFVFISSTLRPTNILERIIPVTEVAVFPNPCRIGEPLNIKIKKPGTHPVLVYDVSGRIVYSSKVTTYDANTNIMVILPVTISSGTYYVRVNNKTVPVILGNSTSYGPLAKTMK